MNNSRLSTAAAGTAAAVAAVALVAVLVTAPTPAISRSDGGANGPPLVGGINCLMAKPNTEALSVLAEDDPRPAIYEEGDFNFGNGLKRQVHGTAEANKYFIQGLRTFYGFNHRESFNAFKAGIEVTKLGEPVCVLCYWGLALSLGVNINQTDQPEPDRRMALDRLIEVTTRPGYHLAPEKERRLVEALTPRYYEESGDQHDRQKKRNQNYAKQMYDLHNDYPDDLDILTLYVDATMNLQPWEYWKKDGSPAYPEITGAVAALKPAVAVNPKHIGLVHWYIHLLEGSIQPDEVTVYARGLAALAPDAGHLVHMPSHIYYRIGDQYSSIAANIAAVAADEKYFREVKLSHPDNDRYRFGYYRHNIHFWLASAVLGGNDGTPSDVDAAAKKLWDSETSPPVDGPITYRMDRYRAAYYQAFTAFAPVSTILNWPDPAASATMPFAHVSWLYAQTLGYILSGDDYDAEITAKALNDAVVDYPGINPPPSAASITAANIMNDLGQARLKASQHKWAEIEAFIEDARVQQGSLIYDEPPYWLVPVDQTAAGIGLANWQQAMIIAQTAAVPLFNSVGWDSRGDPLPNMPYTEFLMNGWAWYAISEIIRGSTIWSQDKAAEADSHYRQSWRKPEIFPDLDRM
ncbi:MAG: tetratricopeptide repeat protein [Azospirillum sp.]|nr:tetratricopeptide repeat protein [Azospirillum sp.]